MLNEALKIQAVTELALTRDSEKAGLDFTTRWYTALGQAVRRDSRVSNDALGLLFTAGEGVKKETAEKLVQALRG